MVTASINEAYLGKQCHSLAGTAGAYWYTCTVLDRSCEIIYARCRRPAEAFITPFKAEHNRVEPFIRFIHLKLHHLPTPEVLLASTFNCSDRDDSKAWSLRCVMELC